MIHLYLTPEDSDEIELASTFEELHGVALRVIPRIPGPVGMVCGPISSGGKASVEENLSELSQAVEKLRQEGNNIFSQLSFEPAMARIKRTAYCKGDVHLLEAFYLPLFEAGLIHKLYFLPSWETSDGASWEHAQAKRLGIEVKYL